MKRFEYDNTLPYVALAPKGKYLRKQDSRRDWKLLAGLFFILLCAYGAASHSSEDRYALETPEPLHARP
ncbi:hypothetical protein [Hymenobacter guriensis]|uniref:Energy transducer TonB n=1 Tax=Hymenobacter guriensis TaxID=2793065 RepID=A0ABS0KWU5_9BACT|nr:hypothetical protein [Hymenobacter guriensis]MBG8552326.1 hypothetical protein [Hymenobacter guriensis]